MPINAIQTTPTLRALEEIIKRKRRRGNPHRELKVVPPPHHLHDVQPQEQDLDADTSQAGEPVLGDIAADGGLVPQLVRALERETARAVEIGVEFT